MKTLIYIGGFYCLIFAIFHLAFWKLFDWKNELPKLKSVNRGVMQVLNLRLTYVFFVVAFLSFFFTDDLINTNLGKVILVSISIFILMRAIEQLIFWKVEKIGIVFFVIFLLGAGIFAAPILF
ncbi:MAG TPA: hypothetical protein PKY82_27370 [Pyrinomonadaceae bacterium]|nr:hypothetical protein [Pyrinomonadaceae bacterium]